MNSRHNRRSFVKRAAAASAALSAVQLFPSPSILRAGSPGKKVNCVLIGCGGRGMNHVSAVADENLVAIVDPSEPRHAAALKALAKKNPNAGNVQAFTDYRQMFDKMAKQIDAVFVAAPNHHHAPASMIAMQLGKNVYCEKPLCHDVAEARRMAEMARRSKVATQMGNQGHCMEGYRRLCEYVWAGAIGQITETHSWTNRANGGFGPRPPAETPPAGLHWESWIGPAPYRDYHEDLVPHEWHGWYDFGNGSLGNLACHVLDGVYWALKLEHPTSFEVEEMYGGTDERCPTGTRIRWDFPARGKMAPVKAYWYDGRVGEGDPGDGNKFNKGEKRPQNLPPLMEEMKKLDPKQKWVDSGTFYVGEKGIFYTATYGQEFHLMPAAKMKDLPEPPKTLSRPQSSFVDFLSACREGRTDTASSFEYGARLTEFALLGNLAQLAGKGKKVLWDGPAMQITNLPELNRFVKRAYRKGWEI